MNKKLKFSIIRLVQQSEKENLKNCVEKKLLSNKPYDIFFPFRSNTN